MLEQKPDQVTEVEPGAGVSKVDAAQGLLSVFAA